MRDHQHLAVELWELAGAGQLASGTLVQLVHDHILECCSECREAWEQLLAQQPQIRDMLGQVSVSGPEPTPPPPSDRYSSAFGAAAERLEAEADRLRKDRRRARRELKALLDIPADQRRQRIFSARTRFRSRALAELLIEESRKRVRTAPHEAHEIAELVPEVLHWTPGADGTAWAAALKARSLAHTANALRVAGDLPRADRAFMELRQVLTQSPLADAEANAEIVSLEASLRIDQRRFEEAADLLDRADHLYRRAGAPEGQARVLIQRAGLEHQIGDDENAEASLRRAVRLLDPERHTQTLLMAIGSHVLSLCNLGRFDEADRALDEQLPAFEQVTDPWTALLLRGLRGRVALGRGEHERARRTFSAVCEGALALGRHLDAAMAALDLAEVALAEGEQDELLQIAAVLVPSFESRGVSRETLAALALLRRAIAAESLSAATLASIRSRLQAQRPT